MAAARASACTLGSATTRSASGTPALTPSGPPELEFVVTLGFEYSSTRISPSPSASPAGGPA
eukprot:2568276-Pleurochrysis_carterae.AAC.1